MTSAPVIREPFAARVLPRKWIYGWYIAIACDCLIFVGVGVRYYGLPIFLKPLKEDHGWSTTQVSIAPAIYFTGSGLTSAFIGPYIDRREHAAAAQVAFRFNSFIGLALAERIAGPEGLLLIAVLIGVCVPLFNIAAVLSLQLSATTTTLLPAGIVGSSVSSVRRMTACSL